MGGRGFADWASACRTARGQSSAATRRAGTKVRWLSLIVLIEHVLSKIVDGADGIAVNPCGYTR
jgi:hypothetical protein